jgi:hypothetical protein
MIALALDLAASLDLEALADLIADNEHELTAFCCVLALSLGFGLALAVIERARRSPVEKIMARRGRGF